MQFCRLSVQSSLLKEVQILLRCKGPGDVDSSKHGRSIVSFLNTGGQNTNGSQEIRECVKREELNS